MIVRELLIGLGVDTDAPSFARGEKAVASLAAKAEEVAGKAGRQRGQGAADVGVGDRLSAEWSTVGGVVEKAANAIANAVREVADLAGHAGRTAAGFRTSARDVQVLEAGFARVGVSGGEVAGVLSSLESKAFGAAFKGDAGAVMGFARLGVSIRGANGQLRTGSELLEAATAKLEKMAPSARRTGLAIDLLGENARYLLAGLDDGSFRRAQKDALEFGGVIGDDVVASTKRLREEQSKLGYVLVNLKQSAAGPLIDSLGRIGHQVTEFIRTQNRSGGTALETSFTQFSRLEGPLAKIGELAYKAVPIIGVLVEIMLGVGNAVASVAAGIGTLGEKVNGLGALLTFVGGILFATFFPVTAVLAAIALAIDDVLTYQRGGDSLIGRMIYGLKEMETEFTKEGKAKPWWLRALLWALDLIAEGIPKALKNLEEALANNSVFKTLDFAARNIELLTGANKGTARAKDTQDQLEVEVRAWERLGAGARFKAFLGQSDEYDAAKAQVRAERAGGGQSLSPEVSAPATINYSSLPSVPAVSLGGSSGGGRAKVLQLTFAPQVQASGPDARQVAAEVQSQIESRVPELLQSVVSVFDDGEAL